MASPRVYQIAFNFGANINSSVGSAFRQAQSNVNGLNGAMVQSSRQAGLTNKSLGGLGAGLRNVAMIAGTYLGFRAVTGFFKSSLETFREFESSMSEVGAISGATGNDFDALAKKAKELGKATSKTASESAQAMKYQALAGWDVKTILESTEPILRLSEAGNLDLARASDIVTDSMSSLGITSKELPEYLDKMAQTSRKANTDIDALGEAFIVAGGTFKNLNTPLYESNAILGILANRGKKGSEAGNALNSIMVNLTTGAGQAGKAMGQLNISAFDSQGKFKGMSNVLKEVHKKTSKMTQEQRNMYLSMIGGKSQLDTLQALLSGVSEEYDTLENSIKNSNGALDDMARIMQDNLDGALTRLGSAVEGFKIDISENLGKEVTPIIDGLANKINTAAPIIIGAFQSAQSFIGTKVIPRFHEIRDITQEITDNYFPNFNLSISDLKTGAGELVTDGLDLVKGGLTWIRDNSTLVQAGVLGVTSAFLTYKGVMLGVTIAQNAHNIALKVSAGYHLLNRARIVAQTTATVTGSSAVGIMTAAQWLWNTALAANPIGVVVIAVGLLTAGIYALYKNFDVVTGAIKKAWDWLTKWNKTDAKDKNVKANTNLTTTTQTTSSVGSIPQLATGGYIKHRPGGILANVGEGRHDEIVAPVPMLEKLLNSSSGITSINNSQQPIQVTYSPVNYFYGNTDKKVIAEVNQKGFEDFKSKFESLQNRNQRLSFSRG